jgi:hypothetical protein
MLCHASNVDNKYENINKDYLLFHNNCHDRADIVREMMRLHEQPSTSHNTHNLQKKDFFNIASKKINIHKKLQRLHFSLLA